MEAEGLHATASSPTGPTTTVLNFRTQTEYLLQNSIIMTEMGMKIKEKCVSSEKYVSYLRNLVTKAAKNVATLHTTSKNFLLLAQKLVTTVISLIDTVPIAVNDQSCYTIKLEYEKLLSIIEREMSDIEMDSPDTVPNLANLSEKIKYLEAKQKMSDHNGLQRTASVKSVKSDVDEKYPENISRESLIDLNTVINLPPVPEDIFTTCSNKPTRTSSLSSLKSIRKVKLFLQRAANHSDDEDLSSDTEDHEFPRITIVSICDSWYHH